MGDAPAKIPEWYTKNPKEFRRDLLNWYLGIPKVVVGLVVVLLIGSLGLRIKREPDTPWYETIFDNLESIALGSAGIIFVLEAVDRQKRDHYEAWQVINSAQGQPGSGGRIQALQDLNRDGVSLEGVAAPMADLSGIDLREAKLSRANFRGAQLDNANLQGAHLWNTNLEGADLSGANLQAASLWNTNLEGADLSGANLQASSLTNVCLSGAYLLKTNLKECTINKWTREEIALAKLCKTTLPENISLDPNRDCEEMRFDPKTGEFIDIENFFN
jgi:uncharacterized protein YjbI with pentapeptide repeats